MIGDLSYEDLTNIIAILNNSNNNLKKIMEYYKENLKAGTVRMERFILEVDNYINYLNNTYKINKDADNALKKIKELNS